MNIIRTTIALLFCHVALCQVSLQTNLPPTIAPNTTLNLEVKISKGSISSFSKYQIDVPAGMTIAENISKTGNFTFDAPRAKIVWVNLPAEPEFVVKFILNTGSVTGPGVFNQKLYYVDEFGKKEFEAEPVNVTVDPSGATTTTSFPETGAVASGNTSPGSASSGNTAASGNPGNTGAGSSGGSSTGNAIASSGSAANSGSSENNAGTSGNTLTSNAGSGSSSGSSGSAAADETKSKENTSASGNSAGNSGSSTAKTIKENPSGGGSSSGLVYKIQLGAYGADPGKAKFAAAGKVTISKEDGFYKVITGSYNTKEEALQAYENLKSKGFSGFVVKYQNGVRVK